MVVSPLAHVHPGARLAEGVVVEPFAMVHEDVEIGEGSWVGSNAVIHNGARIGRNSRIFNGAVIAAIPQDLKFKGETSTVEIGDNVTVREFVTLNRGTSYSYKTVIENNVLLMAYVHIAHDCILKRNAIVANSVNIGGHVRVGEHSVIGGACGIHQFVQIGKHVMIAGGSMVRKDVPHYTLAGRDPLSYVGINHRGLRRRGFSGETIREIQEIYRCVFLQNYNTSQAMERIESTFPVTMERDEILDFLRHSDRGLMKGYLFHEKRNSQSPH